MASAMQSKKRKKRDNVRLSDLKELGLQLLSSRAHINNLPRLLTFVTPSSPAQHALEAIVSLQSFFTPVLPELPSSTSKSKHAQNSGQEDPEFIYRTWLRSKFDEFVKLLIDISVSPQCEETMREVCLDTIMDFVKVGNGGRFHSAIYHRLLHRIVDSVLGIEILLDLLASKYFKYTDICYFTYISLEKLVRTLDTKDISDSKCGNSSENNNDESMTRTELSIRKAHFILTHIPPIESVGEKIDFEMWNESGFDFKKGNVKKHSEPLETEDKHHASDISKKIKLKFNKAWFAFLRLPLPVDVYKEVLVVLHQAVIPHLSNPVLLCDFLTRSYDIGGVISVMSLSSLFILMTKHGLEYPKFYEKLYALLSPSIFMAKHRSKFFELVDSCLKSPLLPAYLAASFAKKLSRLSLSVPPSGVLVIIALIHNLLRRHPSISFLVHREASATSGENSTAGKESDAMSKKLGLDKFRPEENDPLKTDAMRSSLWEIDTLRHHYCPPVSRFVLSLENDLSVRNKTAEVVVKDFSSGSYATIFREEIRRRVKQVPLAYYKEAPSCLFREDDFAGWTFPQTQVDDNEEEDTNNLKRQCVVAV